MRWIAIGLVAALLAASPALAQQWVTTVPLPATTKGGEVSTTIVSTNVFQKVWGVAANSGAPGANVPGTRHGCSIQNNGTNNMYVSEGKTIATATTSNTWVLAAGNLFNCNFNGIVLTGEIDITGTSGDAFFAAQF